MDNSIAIVDFSALFHRLYHANREEAVHRTLGVIRALGEQRVIIAIDSPPYKRKDIEPSYKSNRDVPDPELVGQLRAALEELAKDEYEIAYVDGWEADDVIGSLLRDIEANVYGADKDLLQVTELIDPLTRDLKTAEDHLGVESSQVIDYLCLVGDTSDNIKGIAGIGPKTAVKLLEKFGSLRAILSIATGDVNHEQFSQKTRAAITEAMEWLDTTRELVKIRTDLDVKIDKREREVIDIEPEQSQEEKPATQAIKTVNAAPVVQIEKVGFRRSIEPFGIEQAFRFCQMAHRSGLYQQYKAPEQMMMVVMRGRAFGLDATTSLDAFAMIKGKPVPSAATIAGIIMSSPQCEFLECIYFGDDKSIWETKRVGGRKIITREYTMEEAKRAGDNMQPEYVNRQKTGRMIEKENWTKRPGVMLQWRGVTAIGRQVYPDLMHAIYAREELE